MISYYEFALLSEADQLEIIIDTHRMAVQLKDNCTVLLHSLNGFFVETYYHMELNCVISIKIIESFSELEIYWKEVSLTGIRTK